MTRTSSRGLVFVGCFIALLLVAGVSFIKLDPGTARGTAIGTGLGLVNLAVGYLVTRQVLLHPMRSVIATIAGGFLVRMLALAVLIVLFQRTGLADPAAFALTFLVFFFMYVGVEVLLVERSLGKRRNAL